ncbi:MAG: hypothetical protein IPG91_13025 [Ideonella sp.]|nr:hypothetical protein [Ideonella sp.]
MVLAMPPGAAGGGRADARQHADLAAYAVQTLPSACWRWCARCGRLPVVVRAVDKGDLARLAGRHRKGGGECSGAIILPHLRLYWCCSACRIRTSRVVRRFRECASSIRPAARLLPRASDAADDLDEARQPRYCIRWC